MTRTGILKITLAVSIVFLICMSSAPRRTAVIPLIPSAAADSDDADAAANNDSGAAVKSPGSGKRPG